MDMCERFDETSPTVILSNGSTTKEKVGKPMLDAKISRHIQGSEAVNLKQLSQRIFQLSFFNCIQRRRIRKYSKLVEVFEQATNTIHLSSGIDSLEEIVRIFSVMEDKSFSLMTYVSSAYGEIEQLQTENAKLLKSIETHSAGRTAATGGDADRALYRKQALLQSVEARMRAEDSAVTDKESDVQRIHDITDKARDSILIIIEAIRNLFCKLRLSQDISINEGKLRVPPNSNAISREDVADGTESITFLTLAEPYAIESDDRNAAQVVPNGPGNGMERADSEPGSTSSDDKKSVVGGWNISPSKTRGNGLDFVGVPPQNSNIATITSSQSDRAMMSSCTPTSNLPEKAGEYDSAFRCSVELTHFLKYPHDSGTKELMLFLEQILFDVLFRDYLPAHHANFRQLRRATNLAQAQAHNAISQGHHSHLSQAKRVASSNTNTSSTKRPAELPNIRLDNDSDSDLEDYPLNRGELLQSVKRNLVQRKRRK